MSSSPVQSSIELVPLNRLVASPRNVRRKDRKADIDALAASIAAHGLLQNLCVTPAGDGRYEVEAGGRRLLALKHLARSGVIARDFPVPCHIVAAEEARSVSLTENVHRLAMDAMDEVDAFAALAEEGATPDDIARRFGVTRRHVDQRLALAGLSPKIKAAWKRGDVSLDAARAFCLTPDHARQEAVFRSLGRPVTHAGSVRARLMEGRLRASDRLALFVGLEAYEEAGGALVRDLFDPEAVYVEDPGLLAVLAEARLTEAGEAWLAEGWGWIDIQLTPGHRDDHAPLRLHPGWRDLSSEEAADLARLQADMRALDDALDADSTEDDPRWDQRDDLAAAIETLQLSARVWDRALIAHAGVVRRQDEKRLKQLQAQNAVPDGAVAEAPTVSESESVQPCGDGLPKAVVRDLSAARSRALRLLLARDSHVALATVVAAMLARSCLARDLPGVGVGLRATETDDHPALAEMRAALCECAPDTADKVLAWCLSQPVEALLDMLAVMTAGALDLAHEHGSIIDAQRRSVADALAAALALDMRGFWTADAAYWSRLSKAQLMAALSDAPSVETLSPAAREGVLKAHAKLRRDALAQKVAEAFEGTGYLPDLLVTPYVSGALAVTEAGERLIETGRDPSLH